jgi:hypothetical protein
MDTTPESRAAVAPHGARLKIALDADVGRRRCPEAGLLSPDPGFATPRLDRLQVSQTPHLSQ